MYYEAKESNFKHFMEGLGTVDDVFDAQFFTIPIVSIKTIV